MRRFFLFAGLASVVSLITYLLDPDRGRARRARLADQLSATGRDVADTVSAKARYQKGVVEGMAHEVADVFTAESDYDDETLKQKIRSEAIGPSGIDANEVVIDITDGTVRLTGAVSNTMERQRLVDAIAEVDGVREINDTLTTTS